jgi:hypothetical protein
MRIQIMTQQRATDFLAEVFIDGKKVGWDIGRTRDEATGAAIRTCQKELWAAGVQFMESK